MSSITDTLTSLMDKFREKTGLTDKLTIARATSLMSNLSINNLIANSSSEWITEKGAWNNTFPEILAKKGESYTFTAEIKDISSQVALAAVLYDDKGNVLEPNYDGDAPIHTGNISQAYVISSYRSSGGKMELTFTIRPTNCKYVDFRIVSYALGDFTYRNPIAFKETPLTTVGGVVRAFLYALERHFSPVIGGVA